jgi:E3 ubiquitin-protein ligase BRE1
VGGATPGHRGGPGGGYHNGHGGDGGSNPGGVNGMGGGGGDPAAMARLEGTVAELKGRLEHCASQLDDSTRRCAQLTGEVRKLTDILGDEGHALHTRPYRSLHGQLVNAQEDSARFRNAVSQLQREGEALRAELRAKSMTSSKVASEARRAQLAEARVQDCEARLRAVMGERDEASFRLNQQKETAARQRLNEERALMLDKLQKENAQLRAEANKARGLRAELDAAKLASAHAEAAAKEAKAETTDAKAALEHARSGAPPAEGTPDALKACLDAAERKAIAAEAKAAAAEEQLAEKNAEIEAFMAEVEAIGAAYEESQTDNQRLMQRLTERDDTESKAVTEKVQAQQLTRRLREEKAGLEAAVVHERGAAQAAAHRAAQIEAAAQEQAVELARAREESSQLSVRMDEQTQTLRQLQASSRDHREALEASQRQAAGLSSRSTEDAAAVAAAERKARQCEEQIAGLKRRNEKLLKVGGSSDEFKEEIDAYKSMLRCSVCNDRPKGVVIARCYHMFCKECIDVCLENRHRKCPGCGAAFSANDVHAVYF